MGHLAYGAVLGGIYGTAAEGHPAHRPVEAHA
jgi:hypothetical protein